MISFGQRSFDGVYGRNGFGAVIKMLSRSHAHSLARLTAQYNDTWPSSALERAIMDRVKHRREATILKGKALSSLRRAMAAFNSHEEDGRATEVLLKLQHAFEMLLKASLVQERVEVFDKQLSQSIGFEKCVKLARQHLGVTTDEAGTLRAVDALRDEAQHWFNEVSEGLLYSHARASVTLFDDLLDRTFGEKLVSHLPHRVLPISSEPPKDIQLLIDEEFKQIAELLQPGRRRRPEACARIRTLLAMEAHTAENVRVSRRDVDRVQRGIRAGKSLPEVFPRLSEVGTEISGEGIHVSVRFVRNTTERALGVRYISADDPGDAAAIREVDLQRKYQWTPLALASKLGLTTAKAKALRWKLGIDDNATCTHEFVFGSQHHRMFSDNAYTRMRDALSEIDVDLLWQEYRHRNQAA